VKALSDGGHNAWQVDAALAKVPRLRLAIAKRSDEMKGFVVLPRRWVVERTFSWSGATGASPRISRI
jgi:transposase